MADEGGGKKARLKDDRSVSSSSSDRSSSSSLHGIVTSGIDHPGKNDVMFGRGGDTNYHIGNHRFRMQADKYRQSYREASRKEKGVIVQQLVDSWRAMDPPGRFLTKTEPGKGDDSFWHDVGTELALKKAAKILTERASSKEGKGREKRQAPSAGGEAEGGDMARQRHWQLEQQQQQQQQQQQLQYQQPQQAMALQFQQQQLQQAQMQLVQQQQLQYQQQQLQFHQQSREQQAHQPYIPFASLNPQNSAVASLPQPQLQMPPNPAQQVGFAVPPRPIGLPTQPLVAGHQISQVPSMGTPRQPQRNDGDLGMSSGVQHHSQGAGTGGASDGGSPPEDQQAETNDDSPPTIASVQVDGDAMPSAASLSGVFRGSNSGSGSSEKHNSDSLSSESQTPRANSSDRESLSSEKPNRDSDSGSSDNKPSPGNLANSNSDSGHSEVRCPLTPE